MKLSRWHTGPKKPFMTTPENINECPLVRIGKNKEWGILYGPWIFNGEWDGSYIVSYTDERVAYLYPSKFEVSDFTYGELIDELTKIAERAERKVNDSKS
jgi:hypothetical protein